MRKLALSAIAGFMLAVPGTAYAGDTGDNMHVGNEHAGDNCHSGGHRFDIERHSSGSYGGNGNSFFVCNGDDGDGHGNPGTPGDHISVTTEPSGVNCTNGGVRITVSRFYRNNQVFYVCNGASGPPGASVSVTAESAGANCTAGGIAVTVDNATPTDTSDDTTFYVCNGVAGPQGPAGPAGAQGPAGPAGLPGSRGATGRPAPTCVSTRVAFWRIIVRSDHRVRRFHAAFEGVRTSFTRSTYRGRVRSWRGHTQYIVRVPLRGLGHGVYTVRAVFGLSRGGRRFHPTVRNHTYRTCYGNPKGGGLPGLNRLAVTII